jgi:glucan 1,3-beta-glucosidase
MVPSLFTCAAAPRAGEHDVASGWNNTTSSRQVLERHWDTFIQESDFAYLQSIGINTVRLPIGYWSLGPQFCVGTAFEDVMTVYENSWKRVLRAINTAGAYGIGVLVDLHGAPGSQNGE